MSALTFTGVERRYNFAVEYIDFCRDAALDNASLAREWQNRETLARWFHGSIIEFREEYGRTILAFEAETPEQSESLGTWYEDLDLCVVRAHNAIIAKYPALAKVLR